MQNTRAIGGMFISLGIAAPVAATDVGGLLVGDTTSDTAVARGGGMFIDNQGASIAGDQGADTFNALLNNTAAEGSALYHNVPFDAGGAGDIDASWVCWGTTDQVQIGLMVHDFFDDASRGLVNVLDMLLVLAAWG